jgi:hypothetical protein
LVGEDDSGAIAGHACVPGNPARVFCAFGVMQQQFADAMNLGPTCAFNLLDNLAVQPSPLRVSQAFVHDFPGDYVAECQRSRPLRLLPDEPQATEFGQPSMYRGRFERWLRQQLQQGRLEDRADNGGDPDDVFQVSVQPVDTGHEDVIYALGEVTIFSSEGELADEQRVTLGTGEDGRNPLWRYGRARCEQLPRVVGVKGGEMDNDVRADSWRWALS